MIKYLLPAACIALTSCSVYTYPDYTNPYYTNPPPQPTAYYSYQNLQTPMTQTSLRHPFVQTSPAPKPLTPALKTTIPVYHGPVIAKKLSDAKKSDPVEKTESIMPTK